MSQDIPASDFILGTVGLVLFLIFAFAAGWVLSRFKNARFARAWTPLVPVIQGTVTHDGGGAATSWLTGTYRGRSVRAEMVPDRNLYPGESNARYNYFGITLLDVPGKQDWRVAYQTSFLGMGQAGWQVTAKDPALQERLRARGVVDAVVQLGGQTLTYTAREGTLQYGEDAGPAWVPSPERFRQELDALLLLAAVNAEVNAA
jgi:hypothetical protein